MIFLVVEKRYQHLTLEKLLRSAITATLKHQRVSRGSEVTLVISGDAKLKKLNREFRRQNKITDVLSFPSGEYKREGGRRYLGDVVISLPRARAQAKERGYSLEEELQLLTVHGVLHLLGHDHLLSREKTHMWAAQEDILKKLGHAANTLRNEQLSREH